MSLVYDAIIVGAGPAGAFCAWQLAKNNMKVLLIDSATKTKRKVCGEYLCPRGVELLKQHGLHLFAETQFLPLFGMKIVTAQGTEVNTVFPATSGKNYGLSLQRDIFDQHLLNKAINAGAEFHSSETFVEYKNFQSLLLVQTNAGQYKSRIIIGADGRKSKVSQQIGAQLPATNKRVALHAYLKPKETPERFGEMHILKDAAYFGVDPIHDSEVNISLVCDGEKIRELGGSHATWNHYIHQSPQLLKQFGTLSNQMTLHTTSPIQNSVSKMRAHNVALVGDAAGFVDPLTGEGIYNALYSADLLSRELVKEFNSSINNFTPALVRYEAQYKKAIAEKSKLNRIFQWVIRHPQVVEFIAWFLNTNPHRANSFVGVIGNVYSPQKGLIEILKGKAS